MGIITILGIIYAKVVNKNGLLKLLIFLLIGLLLCEFSNDVLKHYFFKPLSEKYGEYLGLLGKIGRPDGAYNCDFIRNGKKILSTSSGMPSGHSQVAWFMFGFLVNILYRANKTFNSNFLIFVILGSIISGCMSYSRVIINCHTIEQIIMGSIIGFIFGYYWYDLFLFIT